MAYAQWVSIKIIAHGTTLRIKNAKLRWGKFHQTGNKEVEISPDDINKITIEPKRETFINSCGRSDSGSGTEGDFDIFDGDTKVGHYHWDCPWTQKKNTSTWTPDSSEGYLTQVAGANLDSGALGNITIECVKKRD